MGISARYNSLPRCCTWWLNSPPYCDTLPERLFIELAGEDNVVAVENQNDNTFSNPERGATWRMCLNPARCGSLECLQNFDRHK